MQWVGMFKLEKNLGWSLSLSHKRTYIQTLRYTAYNNLRYQISLDNDLLSNWISFAVVITNIIYSTWFSKQLIMMEIISIIIIITIIINKCSTNLFPWCSLRHKRDHSKNPCYPTASLWRRIYTVWMGIDLEFLL